MNDTYLPRISDKRLQLALKTAGAVLIVGPKWCGKTRTAEEVSKSALYMQDPDHSDEYRLLIVFMEKSTTIATNWMSKWMLLSN